jgi:hypothetical protein
MEQDKGYIAIPGTLLASKSAQMDEAEFWSPWYANHNIEFVDSLGWPMLPRSIFTLKRFERAVPCCILSVFINFL